MTTIFTTLPPVGEWIAVAVGIFLLLSWLYVLSLVRSLRRTVDDLVADVRHTADRLSGTTLEQGRTHLPHRLAVNDLALADGAEARLRRDAIPNAEAVPFRANRGKLPARGLL